MKKKSLKQKVIWRFSIFVFLTMSAISVLVAFMVSSALNHQLRQSLTQEAESALKRIEYRVSYLAEQTKIFSKNHLLTNSLIDVQGRKLYLPELVKNFKQFEGVKSITVVDFNGKSIYSSKKTLKPPYSRTKFRSVLEMGNSIFEFNKTAKSIIFTEPIIYYDTPQGAVIAEFNLSNIAKRASIKKGDTYFKSFIHDELFQEQFYKKNSSYVSVSVKSDDGSPFLKKLDFKLQMGKLSSVYFLPVKEIMFRLSLVSFLVIFLAIILSTRMGTAFSKPILELCNRVAVGGLCSPTGTDDELETLAQIFDKQHLEVKEATEKLENRVTHRTLELTSSNQKLKLEIEIRNKTEVQLKEAKDDAENANRAKSLFLANMSHEIRTPLNAVLGYSQILLMKKDLDNETKDSIRTIDTSGKNLLSLINDILDISKIEAGKIELNITGFDLKSLINHVSNIFKLRCQQKDLEWKVSEVSEFVNVQGDEDKLQQVLINLIGNAIKFTDSGQVEFVVTPMNNNQYKFDVIDTGKGIPPESQDKIFDAFYQGKEGLQKGGTGLGLAISKKLLELMGSDLLFKSEVNKGSHFHFTLTLPPSGKEVVDDRRGQHRTILSLVPETKIKALIVDDIKENQDVLSCLLSIIGVETITAVNGKDGVDKTREHLPDIIFMDIRMPVMNGEEATKLIQEEFGKDRFKIVAVTADAIGSRRDHYLSKGFHEFIPKPFRAEEIYNSLSELLGTEFVYEDE